MLGLGQIPVSSAPARNSDSMLTVGSDGSERIERRWHTDCGRPPADLRYRQLKFERLDLINGA